MTMFNTDNSEDSEDSEEPNPTDLLLSIAGMLGGADAAKQLVKSETPDGPDDLAELVVTVSETTGIDAEVVRRLSAVGGAAIRQALDAAPDDKPYSPYVTAIQSVEYGPETVMLRLISHADVLVPLVQQIEAVVRFEGIYRTLGYEPADGRVVYRDLSD
jgi:hypothetical protein